MCQALLKIHCISSLATNNPVVDTIIPILKMTEIGTFPASPRQSEDLNLGSLILELVPLTRESAGYRVAVRLKGVPHAWSPDVQAVLRLGRDNGKRPIESLACLSQCVAGHLHALPLYSLA